MMISLRRTKADDLAFKGLVLRLNEDLATRDGGDHPLAQFNSIAKLSHVLVAHFDKEAIGCGAIAKYDDRTMEVKRMYVMPDFRGQRIGEQLLKGLEEWSRELGMDRCILFMGSRQPEAQQLYLRNGYQVIEKYGPLIDIPDSQCFAKMLT